MGRHKKFEDPMTSFGFNILISELEALRTIAHERTREGGPVVHIGDLVRESIHERYPHIRGAQAKEEDR